MSMALAPHGTTVNPPHFVLEQCVVGLDTAGNHIGDAQRRDNTDLRGQARAPDIGVDVDHLTPGRGDCAGDVCGDRRLGGARTGGGEDHERSDPVDGVQHVECDSVKHLLQFGASGR